MKEELKNILCEEFLKKAEEMVEEIETKKDGDISSLLLSLAYGQIGQVFAKVAERLKELNNLEVNS